MSGIFPWLVALRKECLTKIGGVVSGLCRRMEHEMFVLKFLNEMSVLSWFWRSHGDQFESISLNNAIKTNVQRYLIN